MFKNFIYSGFLIFAFLFCIFGQSNIRKVDFKNFTYKPTCVDAKVKVTNATIKNIKTVNGFNEPIDDNLPSYFDTYEPIYGDVTGDGQEDAVIQSHCNTGGTGQFTEAYLYALHLGKPILLAIIEGGDRGYGGIRSIEIKNGTIIVDQNDAGEDGANCCAEHAVKTHYKWQGNKLIVATTEPRREIYPKKRVTFEKGKSKTDITLNVDDIKRFVVGAKAGQTLIVTVNSRKVEVSLSNDETTETKLNNGFKANLNQSGDYVFQIEPLDKAVNNVLLTIEIR
jgi:hypothetical protein